MNAPISNSRRLHRRSARCCSPSSAQRKKFASAGSMSVCPVGPAASTAFRQRRFDLLGLVEHDDRILRKIENRVGRVAAPAEPRTPSRGNASPGLATPSYSASPRSREAAARDFGYSASGSTIASFTFSTDRCVSTSNRRMESISSPKNSTRTGWFDSAGKTSRIPPRTEYSPVISTGSRRSYPIDSRCAVSMSSGISSPVRSVTASCR